MVIISPDHFRPYISGAQALPFGGWLFFFGSARLVRWWSNLLRWSNQRGQTLDLGSGKPLFSRRHPLPKTKKKREFTTEKWWKREVESLSFLGIPQFSGYVSFREGRGFTPNLNLQKCQGLHLG